MSSLKFQDILKYAAIAEEGAEIIADAKADFADAKSGKTFEEHIAVTIDGQPFEYYAGLRPVQAAANTSF